MPNLAEMMMKEAHVRQKTKVIERLKEENERMRNTLERIRDRDWVENTLDSQWAASIASYTLRHYRG